MPPESRPTAKRESPQFTGRVIAALYDSDQRMQLSGRALIGAELGAFLGVTDVDGSHPLSDRYTMGGRLSFIRLSWLDRNLSGLSGHIGHAEAHRKAGFIQCVESEPSRLKCIVSRHWLPRYPPAQHGHQDKLRAHGTLGVEIERINCREHTARLAANSRFLEKLALGRSLDGFAKLDFAAGEPPPACIGRILPPPPKFHGKIEAQRGAIKALLAAARGAAQGRAQYFAHHDR